MTHAKVAVAAPVRCLYSYEAPGELAVQPGHLVEVPFGRSRKRAIVVEVGGPPPEGLALKPIACRVEDQPVLAPALLRTLRWAADYYLAPVGEMLFAALPPPFRKTAAHLGPKRRREVEARPGAQAIDQAALLRRAPVQARLLARLQADGPALVAALEAAEPSARSALQALVQKNLIVLRDADQPRRPDAPVEEAARTPAVLTTEQAQALGAIVDALRAGRTDTFLLRGVTGSGKTEVYLQAIDCALALGRGAILLVPEIALTPQLAGRVVARFGSRVAILHSGLGQGERLDEWRRLWAGEAQVAVGARSALFAPVRAPALIVVDEEHDSSYKQSERLSYNGRDLALVRAREEGAVVVLGSATPSLESHQRSLEGRGRLLTLSQRIAARPLPRIEVVDLREVLDPLERAHTLSPALADALAETLDRREQAILFLNRRGYSSFALCRGCGEALRCSNCSVALVHHLEGQELRCHYCGLTLRLPAPCPNCQRGRVQLFGLGTEKCEHEVRRRFPGARVLRLDSDSVGRKGSLQEVLARFAAGDADVLVGTQMVTKGHDLPGVTLVGVVMADLGLTLPDFRAAERTFQQLVQVAGRAGRGDRPGRVIVQSFLPRHECIVLAREGRDLDFYEREIRRRRDLGYPPFRRLMLIRLSHPDEAAVSGLSRAAAALVQAELGDRLQLLGPVASPLAKLRKQYRFQMLLKARRIEDLHRAAQAVLRGLSPPAGMKIVFDVDPIDML